MGQSWVGSSEVIVLRSCHLLGHLSFLSEVVIGPDVVVNIYNPGIWEVRHEDCKFDPSMGQAI
jgi:hypothetical protein